MRVLTVFGLMVVLALAGPAAAQSKRAKDVKAAPASDHGHSHGHGNVEEDGDDLPKAAPRGREGKPIPLPPFLGFFGPETLLTKTGFRGELGSWIEFELKSADSGGASRGTLRIQQVGPAVRGGRWIELLANAHEGSGGVRMLARGEKESNVERMVAHAPGIAPIELPLDRARIGDLAPGLKPEDAAKMGELKHQGKKKIKVPLGEFLADHWVVQAGEKKLEFWTTSDPKVPFSGMIKLSADDAICEAAAVGTDAVAKIPLPARAD